MNENISTFSAIRQSLATLWQKKRRLWSVFIYQIAFSFILISIIEIFGDETAMNPWFLTLSSAMQTLISFLALFTLCQIAFDDEQRLKESILLRAQEFLRRKYVWVLLFFDTALLIACTEFIKHTAPSPTSVHMTAHSGVSESQLWAGIALGLVLIALVNIMKATCLQWLLTVISRDYFRGRDTPPLELVIANKSTFITALMSQYLLAMILFIPGRLIPQAFSTVTGLHGSSPVIARFVISFFSSAGSLFEYLVGAAVIVEICKSHSLQASSKKNDSQS